MTVWLLAVSMLLSGCWSSIELNNRAFVSIMCIDQVKEGVELTLAFPLTTKLIPGMAGGGESEIKKNFTYVTRSGPSLEDALQKIQADISRKITFRQTHNIVVGSRYAAGGIGNVLEFITRNPYLRLNNNLFVIEGEARGPLSQAPVFFERFTVTVLDSYVQNHNLYDTTVRDFLFSGANGGDALVPFLEFTKKNSLPEPDAKPSLGTGSTAIFKKGKLTETKLDPNATKGAFSIAGKLRDLTYSIPSPTDGRNVGMLITSSPTRIRPVLKNGELTIDILCKGEASVISSDSNIDLQDTEALISLRSALEEVGLENIEAALAQTQKAGADVFGFGNYVSAKYPKLWKEIEKDWRSYYRDKLRFSAKAVVNLKRSGTTAQSVKTKFLID